MATQPIPKHHQLQAGSSYCSDPGCDCGKDLRKMLEQVNDREKLSSLSQSRTSRWKVLSFASRARTMVRKSDTKKYNWLDALFLLMVVVSVVGLVYELYVTSE